MAKGWNCFCKPLTGYVNTIIWRRGTEAERIILFLILPHVPSVVAHSFHRIETNLGELTHEISQSEINTALEEEITSQLNIEGRIDDLDAWKKKTIRPLVNVSYDMGWQKRSSGHRYDSMSGHGLIIGEHTQKVLGYTVKIKDCRTCNKYKTAEDIPIQICPKNHQGSSKSMEVDGILELVTEAWE